MLKYMLDTNIVIYITKKKPPNVKDIFNKYYGQICISTVVEMELIYGVEKSNKPEHNLAIVEGFSARVDILSYDNGVAIHTGQIRAELAKKGTLIGPYDQMIAGHARSQGLILVTNNTAEFNRVPGLRIENWV